MIEYIIKGLEQKNKEIAKAGAMEENAIIRKKIGICWMNLESLIEYMKDLRGLQKKYEEVTRNEERGAGENIEGGYGDGGGKNGGKCGGWVAYELSGDSKLQKKG